MSCGWQMYIVLTLNIWAFGVEMLDRNKITQKPLCEVKAVLSTDLATSEIEAGCRK